jgi:hypothetical protein
LQFDLRRIGNFPNRSDLSRRIIMDAGGEYPIKVKLHPGLQELWLRVLTEPTINILPNGDTRPLLVQLRGIEILPVDD